MDNPDLETTCFPNTTLIYPCAIFFLCQYSRLEEIQYHWELQKEKCQIIHPSIGVLISTCHQRVCIGVSWEGEDSGSYCTFDFYFFFFFPPNSSFHCISLLSLLLPKRHTRSSQDVSKSKSKESHL